MNTALAPTREDLEVELFHALTLAKKHSVHQSINTLLMLLEELRGQPDSLFKNNQMQQAIDEELYKLDGFEKKERLKLILPLLQEIVEEFDILLQTITSEGYGHRVDMFALQRRSRQHHQQLQRIIESSDLRAAEELMLNINDLDYKVRNLVTNNALTINKLKKLKQNFSQIPWTDALWAQDLLQQALQGPPENAPKLMHQLMQLIES